MDSMSKPKGFTLIEVLAVVVILGVLATIAYPTIGLLIENNKKDAYISSAKNLSSSARLAYFDYPNEFLNGQITVEKLSELGYVENVVKDPWDGIIDSANSFVKIDSKTREYYVELKSDSGYNINSAKISEITRDDIEVPIS